MAELPEDLGRLVSEACAIAKLIEPNNKVTFTWTPNGAELHLLFGNMQVAETCYGHLCKLRQAYDMTAASDWVADYPEPGISAGTLESIPAGPSEVEVRQWAMGLIMAADGGVSMPMNAAVRLANWLTEYALTGSIADVARSNGDPE